MPPLQVAQVSGMLHGSYQRGSYRSSLYQLPQRNRRRGPGNLKKDAGEGGLPDHGSCDITRFKQMGVKEAFRRVFAMLKTRNESLS